jgi:hypothetical protein
VSHLQEPQGLIFCDKQCQLIGHELDLIREADQRPFNIFVNILVGPFSLSKFTYNDIDYWIFGEQHYLKEEPFMKNRLNVNVRNTNRVEFTGTHPHVMDICRYIYAVAATAKIKKYHVDMYIELPYEARYYKGEPKDPTKEDEEMYADDEPLSTLDRLRSMIDLMHCTFDVNCDVHPYGRFHFADYRSEQHKILARLTPEQLKAVQKIVLLDNNVLYELREYFSKLQPKINAEEYLNGLSTRFVKTYKTYTVSPARKQLIKLEEQGDVFVAAKIVDYFLGQPLSQKNFEFDSESWIMDATLLGRLFRKDVASKLRFVYVGDYHATVYRNFFTFLKTGERVYMSQEEDFDDERDFIDLAQTTASTFNNYINVKI